MKKALFSLLLVVLALAIPAQALAVTAQYATTQSFLDALDGAGTRYNWLGLDNDNDENVRITLSGQYAGSITANWYFDEALHTVGVRVWNIITYSDADYLNVLEAVSSLNSRFRYVCLYADTRDNTVTAKFDMPIPSANCGSMCVDMMSNIFYLVDIAYNALIPYDTTGK